MAVNIQKFLLAIKQNGGSATTTEIKAEEGYTSSEVHYRYDLAEERGFIQTEQPTPENGRPKAKLAKLTQDGEQWLKQRSSRQALNEDQVVTSRAEIQRLHERIDVLESRIEAQQELLIKIRRWINQSVGYIRDLHALFESGYFEEADIGEYRKDFTRDSE